MKKKKNQTNDYSETFKGSVQHTHELKTENPRGNMKKLFECFLS